MSPVCVADDHLPYVLQHAKIVFSLKEHSRTAPHTQTPPWSTTGQVPAFHLAALPRVRRWSRWSRLYGVWVPGSCPAVSLAPKDHLTWLCDSVCPASSQVQGHPPHSSEGSPCLVRGITVLLPKDVMEPVPPADMKAGFFSPYIIVPKKSGGLRPILGLRILNWAFHKPPFKMLMQNRIFGCIRPQVWSAAFDLKDPYFHVSILPRHRPFLRFAFEGRAYQYKVLPFGLSLSPRVFTKVAEAALVPLREQGVRILNYLDDWLILAQSQDQLCEHRDLVLSHLSQLGLRVNWEKSKLLPTQELRRSRHWGRSI